MMVEKLQIKPYTAHNNESYQDAEGSQQKPCLSQFNLT